MARDRAAVPSPSPSPSLSGRLPRPDESGRDSCVPGVLSAGHRDLLGRTGTGSDGRSLWPPRASASEQRPASRGCRGLSLQLPNYCGPLKRLRDSGHHDPARGGCRAGRTGGEVPPRPKRPLLSATREVMGHMRAQEAGSPHPKADQNLQLE